MTIPIIGQPKIPDWSFSCVIQCTCGNTMLWSGKPGFGTFVMCVPCKRAYTVPIMPAQDPTNGEVDVQLGIKIIPEGK